MDHIWAAFKDWQVSPLTFTRLASFHVFHPCCSRTDADCFLRIGVATHLGVLFGGRSTCVLSAPRVYPPTIHANPLLLVYGITLFLPSIINSFGYSTAISQLLTVPPYVFASAFPFFLFLPFPFSRCPPHDFTMQQWSFSPSRTSPTSSAYALRSSLGV